eukprot:SAG11_NODE_26224_length_348_cov_0.706827_1_plen_42_part_01
MTKYKFLLATGTAVWHEKEKFVKFVKDETRIAESFLHTFQEV